MSGGRLRRFLHLERARAGDPATVADAPAPAPGRFEGVERPPVGPAPASRTGARLERFGPEPEPSIELLETADGSRPFTRCVRCGMDHPIFATACAGCGASLDTPEQHAFNEGLWASRQADAAREAEADRERKARRDAAEAEESRARDGWSAGRWGGGGWDEEPWSGGGRGSDAALAVALRVLRRLLWRRW